MSTKDNTRVTWIRKPTNEDLVGLIDSSQAAKLLDTTPEYLADIRCRPRGPMAELPIIRIDRRSIRYRQSDIDQFLLAHPASVREG